MTGPGVPPGTRARPCPTLRSVGAAALLAAALAVAGCGDRSDVVTVGSKFFTEQDILGELIAVWIERTTDLRVRRRLHLGGTFVCHRALEEGEIDLYVEYTGTALTAILDRPPRPDPVAVLDTVRRVYRDSLRLTWTEPLGFENSFAVLVRRPTADSLGLETLSDAVPHAVDWVPGMGYEFVEREDGLPGLKRAYGLAFASGPRTMEIGLLYRALAEGRVDVIAGNATDGRIEALDLVALRDDRGYFPPYEAVPVVRSSVLEDHPGLRASLRRLGGRISTAEMRRMNEAVSVDGRDYREVARAWVVRVLGSESGAAEGEPGGRTREPAGS